MYENWKILKTQIEEKADEYSAVADWCNEIGYTIVDDGKYYKTVKLPELAPLADEEIKQMREKAYEAEVDPITAHIQRLRDMEQTEEIATEIAELITERDVKVQEIKERYPYNEGKAYECN